MGPNPARLELISGSFSEYRTPLQGTKYFFLGKLPFVDTALPRSEHDTVDSEESPRVYSHLRLGEKTV